MRLIAISLLAACCAAAQAPARKKAPAPQPAAAKAPEVPAVFPILSIHATGSKLYSEVEIVAESGLKLGQAGSERAFNEARDMLIALGVFTSVAYQYESAAGGQPGYKLTFEVMDFDQTYPVRFARLDVPDAELSGHLKKSLPFYREPIAPTPLMLTRTRKAIEEYLTAKGKPMKVASRMTTNNTAEVHVLFHPEGAPPVIAEVRFKGNQVIPSTALQNTIHGVAIGVEYREPFFRELLQNSVVPLYEARGRLRVKFPEIKVETASKVKGLALTVKIEEGESYKLRHVRVEGTSTMNEDLMKVTKLVEEDIANFEEVKAAQGRIKQRLMTGGYLRAASKVERTIDDAKKTVDVTFQVDSGPRFNFGKLEIKGLDIIGAAAIKKAWALEAGKPFNADYPQFFLNRVREDNMFDDLGETRFTLAPNDKDLIVDVTLIFMGTKPQPKK